MRRAGGGGSGGMGSSKIRWGRVGFGVAGVRLVLLSYFFKNDVVRCYSLCVFFEKYVSVWRYV